MPDFLHLILPSADGVRQCDPASNLILLVTVDNVKECRPIHMPDYWRWAVLPNWPTQENLAV